MISLLHNIYCYLRKSLICNTIVLDMKLVHSKNTGIFHGNIGGVNTPLMIYHDRCAVSETTLLSSSNINTQHSLTSHWQLQKPSEFPSLLGDCA